MNNSLSQAFPISIQAGGENLHFDCPAGENLLYEALRAGVSLGYSCASGTCGTCAVRVLNGSVSNLWPGAPGLYGGKSNRVLACQSTPLGPVAIEAAVVPEAQLRARVKPAYQLASVAGLNWPTPEVAELSLHLDEPFDFVPGQFCLLWFPGVEGPRALSIASMRNKRGRELRFFVRPKQKSRLDSYLRSSATWARVRFFGPLGNACLDEADTQSNITCIAGSTGLAPMLPILSKWSESPSTCRASLIYAVRRGADAFPMRYLSSIAAQAGDRLSIVLALSEPASGEVDQTQRRWGGIARVMASYAHEALASILEGQPISGIAFVAGPKPMVQATVRTLVLNAHVTPTSIRSDDFG